MQNHQQSPTLSRKPPLPPTPKSLPNPVNPLPPTRPDPKAHSSSSHSTQSAVRSDLPENQLPPPPPPPPTSMKNAGAIVAVEKYYSPLTSPLPVTPPNDVVPQPSGQIVTFTAKEAAPPHSSGVGGRKREVGLGLGGENNVINKAALGIRVLEVAFCLVSFSVMATDKTQGWSGDSFGRYKEYRFCLTVNIIGFVYAGFQAFDLSYLLATGKHVINHHLRFHFDFIIDQIIAYLLISASSAATTRVVDWELNWGKDDFTKKTSASVSMAFLAFFGFAVSSLISGYNLCNRDIS